MEHTPLWIYCAFLWYYWQKNCLNLYDLSEIIGVSEYWRVDTVLACPGLHLEICTVQYYNKKQSYMHRLRKGSALIPIVQRHMIIDQMPQCETRYCSEIVLYIVRRSSWKLPLFIFVLQRGCSGLFPFTNTKPWTFAK